MVLAVASVSRHSLDADTELEEEEESYMPAAACR